MYKELVVRSILGLLEVELPTFHVHLQQHLGGDTERFLLDLQGKEASQFNSLSSCHAIQRWLVCGQVGPFVRLMGGWTPTDAPQGGGDRFKELPQT